MNIQKILLVDDEPDIRTVGTISLADVGGFEVITASSGGEAIERARADRPDLILLDVMMPGTDGPTAMKTLAGDPETASIPVIFMTAKVQKSEVERFCALGALGVIAKPFDPMALPDEVRRLTEGR